MLCVHDCLRCWDEIAPVAGACDACMWQPEGHTDRVKPRGVYEVSLVVSEGYASSLYTSDRSTGAWRETTLGSPTICNKKVE